MWLSRLLLWLCIGVVQAGAGDASKDGQFARPERLLEDSGLVRSLRVTTSLKFSKNRVDGLVLL